MDKILILIIKIILLYMVNYYLDFLLHYQVYIIKIIGIDNPTEEYDIFLPNYFRTVHISPYYYGNYKINNLNIDTVYYKITNFNIMKTDVYLYNFSHHLMNGI